MPLGNGRIGAMVYGNVSRERIALNEDTLWTGGPAEIKPYGIPENIDTVRRRPPRTEIHRRLPTHQ
jgi:alpha-L-fucosidase 2